MAKLITIRAASDRGRHLVLIYLSEKSNGYSGQSYRLDGRASNLRYKADGAQIPIIYRPSCAPHPLTPSPPQPRNGSHGPQLHAGPNTSQFLTFCLLRSARKERDRMSSVEVPVWILTATNIFLLSSRKQMNLPDYNSIPEKKKKKVF